MRIFVLLAVLSATIASQAATLLYWDTNGTTNGSGGLSPSGNWGSAALNWTTSAAGTASTAAFTSGNTAVFSAGTDATGGFTVSVNTAQTVDSIVVEEGFPQLVGSAGITLSGTGNIDVTNGAKLAIANVISGSSGITKNGNGTLGLSGANAFTGGVNLNGGVTVIANASGLGTGTSALNFNAGTLRYDGASGTIVSSSRSIIVNSVGGTIEITNPAVVATYAGTLSGSGTLTLLGPGTLSLTAAGTSSGSFMVNGGTLEVKNTSGSATGSGAVSISPTATLAGNGSIGGPLNLNGTIRPGASPGTISTGNETWFGGGVYVWEINNATGTGGADPGWDTININGSLNINSTPTNKFTISITSLSAANSPGVAGNFSDTSDYTWRIVGTTGGVTGFDPAAINLVTNNFLNYPGNGAFAVELANNGKDLVVRFAHPPSVTVQPSYTNVVEGSSVSLIATVTGDAPFNLQWKKNGTIIPDATNSVLTLNNVGPLNNGYYSVGVANRFGSSVSPAVGVNIIAPPCALVPAGIVAWWPGMFSAIDVVANRNGIESNVTYNGGKVGFGFEFDGATNYVRVPDDAAFHGNKVSVEAWVKGNSSQTSRYLFSKSLNSGFASYALYTGSGGGLQFYVGQTNGSYAVSPDCGTNIWDGKFHHVVGSYDNTFVRLFVDGVEIGTGTVATGPIAYGNNYAGGDLFIGSFDTNVNSFHFQGIVDELTIYNRGLSLSEIQLLFNAKSAGKCGMPSCTPAPSGLQHIWRAEGNSGDSVGSANGTLTGGASFVQGQVGQAFNFDGQSGSVTANLNASSGNYTVETWVKFDGSFARASYNTILEFGNDAPWFGVTGDGELAVFGVVAGGQVPEGRWTHVAYSWDGSDSRLYIDGSEVASARVAPPTDGVGMGIGYNYGDTPWLGGIDELSLYNRALGGAEIQAIYNAGIAGKCSSSLACTAAPSGLVAWWPGNGSATDVTGGNNGTLQNGATFSGGKINSAFFFDGTDDYVKISNSAVLMPTNLTVETWIYPTDVSGSWHSIVAHGSSTGTQDAYFLGIYNGEVDFDTYHTSGTANGLHAYTLSPYQWYHVAATFDGSMKRLYVNGLEVTNVSFPYPLGYDASVPLTIGDDWNYNAAANIPFAGLVDEVSIYNRALTVGEIQTIYSSEFLGKCLPNSGTSSAPSIVMQPQSITNAPGSTAVFYVVADGGEQPLTYQWKKNGEPLSSTGNISGANSAVLIISSISTADQGTYSVLVSNGQGSTNSFGAQLTVSNFGGENFDSLISYWHADGDAKDSFGVNHGTLLGTAAFGGGKLNQGFYFDGTNTTASVSIPDSASLKPTNVTVEAWVRFDSLDSYTQGGAPSGTEYLLFKKNSRVNQFEGYTLVKQRVGAVDRLQFAVASAAGVQVIATSTTTVIPGIFYHVVGTFDGGTVALYVNGALEDSKPASITLDYGTSPLYFGSSGEAWDGKLSGILDEIRLYGRAISGAEVRAHYTQGNLGFVGLKLASTNYVDRSAVDRALGIAISGGYAYVSGVVGTNGGDAMISRFALPTQSTNSPLWQTNWPGLAGFDRFSGVVVGQDGVYFGGESYARTADSFGTKENKGMIVKFPFSGPNSTNSGFGGSVWDKQVPASPGAFSFSGKETINGVASTTEIINDTITTIIYAAGSAQRSSANEGRMFLTKMRGDGTILWTTTDSSATSATSDAFSTAAGVTLFNGSIFVAGRSDDGGSPKAMIAKVSSTGVQQWKVGSSSGYFTAITAFGGTLYAVGATSTNSWNADALIQKLDDSGNIIWTRTYGSVEMEDVLNGVVGIGSRIYAVGSTRNINGDTDAAILEIDTATGDLISATPFGGSGDDSATAAATDGTDLYVVGESKSYGGAGSNIMLLRYLISQPAVSLDISAATLPYGVVSNSYSFRLTGVGGVPPYSWSLATNSPSLPVGLSLSSGGVISGKPTSATSANVVIQLADASTPPTTVTRSMTLTVLSALTPPTVTFVTPTNGTTFDAGSSASIIVTATDTDGLNRIDLYSNGSVVDSARGLPSSATATFTANSLVAGSYDLYAVAYDIYDTPATSAVVHVTVNGTGLKAIDFEPFDIAAGAVGVTEPSISSYLGRFGISLSDVTAGSSLIINRDSNFGSGSVVTASSGKNLFTQVGKNGAVSYVLNFASPAASFRFTRVKVVGNAAGVTHPTWRATAYAGATILGSVGENAFTTYSSVAEQQYTLYGPNITSVKIEADNYNYATFNSAMLDDFVVVTNAAVIDNQPPTVSIATPANGASFTSPATVTIAANASDPDGTVSTVKLYLGRTLLTTLSGASASYTLANLAPNAAGYQIRAEATDNQGAVKSSDTVTFYVTEAAGVNVINFDAVDASSKTIATTNLASYLNQYGVTVSNITAGSRLEIANVKNINGGSIIASSSPENVLMHSTRSGAISYMLRFATPVQNVRFTRPRLVASAVGVTFPQWRARAYDSSGNEVTSVGENLFFSAADVPAQTFDLPANNIVSVRFDSDGQGRSTVSGLIIDDLILNTNAVTRPLTVAITSPVNNSVYASAPATVTLNASATGSEPIDHVEFYAGPLLIGTSSTSPYTTVWTNVYPGNYELRAVAIDTQLRKVISDTVNITVSGGTLVNNSTYINFDVVDASSGFVTGAGVETYLGDFGITVEADSGSTNAIANQQSLRNAANLSGVSANSPQNVFTTIGATDHPGFSLSFRDPLTQVQFTRVKLIAGVNGVSHSAWQAFAYDVAGNVIASVSESFISSYADVAAKSYTLTGQGIVRVRFESFNRNASTLKALVMDDLILTRPTGNLRPAVALTSPRSGEAFYAPGNFTLKADAFDPDGNIAQVAFYANGSLLASVTEQPYELRVTNLTLGRYSITAVATDLAGETNVSSPVTISIIPSPFEFAIWRQPVNQSVAIGGSATFAVTATGTNAISYQWQFEGVNISGATAATLSLNNVSESDAGTYRVIVTSEGISLTSSNATLTIGASPSITTQPIGQSVSAGEDVTLSVTATGAGTLNYQWLLNGNRIAGATDSSYTITGAQPYDSGFYQVVVFNPLGYAASDKVNITVLSGGATPTSADNFADRISINPLLGSVFGNNEQATKETGEPDHAGKRGGKSVWYTWHASFSGMMTLSTKGSSFDTLLAVYTGNSVTNLTLVASDDDNGGYFSSQLAFNAVEGTDYQIAVDGFRGASGALVLGLMSGDGYRVLDSAAGEATPHITVQPQSQIIDDGGTAVLSVTATGPDPLTYQWYFNGVEISDATDASLTIASFSEESVGRYHVVVANDAGSDSSIPATLEVAFATEGVTTATSQDKLGDITVIESEDGGEEASRPGTKAGTSRGYTTTQVFSTVGASKEADEPNHCGVVGGASVWYGYLAPASGTLSVDTIGSTFDTILAVYTTPSGFLDFNTLQSRGCTNVSGNGGEVVKVAATVNTIYYIVVDGVAGATGTVHLNINLGTAPTITAAPQNATVASAGGSASFSVSASGSTNLYYRWRFNNGEIAGATNTTLSVTNVQPGSNTGLYSVVVSNLVNSVTSTPVLLDLATAPSVTTQPQNTNGIYNKSITLSVVGAGTAPLRYQWQLNNVNIAGATNSTYTKSGLRLTNAGNYTVVITNIAGAVTSSVATVGVLPGPPLIKLPLANTRYTNVGTVVNFSGNVTNGMGVTNVQYQINGGAFENASLVSTNWTAAVTLNRAGTNVITFRSSNPYGDSTTTNRNVYAYQVLPVTVIINSDGAGTIIPKTTGVTNGQRLEIGKTYTITATPAALSGQAYIFTNWGGALSGTTNRLSFQMQSNMVIEANFAQNPFIGAKGSYNGLFTNSTVDYKYSGGTLITLLSSQSFSGTLSIDGDKCAFSGKFTVDGHAQVVASRNTFGKPPITVDLTVIFGSDQITGTVSYDGVTSQLIADRATFSSSNIQTNWSGKYTMILPHDSSPNNSPGGYGFGVVTVSTNGLITTGGSFLGDNTALAQSVPIAKDGRWPLFAALYLQKYVTNKYSTPAVLVTNFGYRGAIMGWLQFTNNSAIGGNLKWFKTTVTNNNLPGGYVSPYRTNYPAGFTNQMEITGLQYNPVATGRAIFPTLTYAPFASKNATNMVVIFEDGNLTSAFTNAVLLRTNNTAYLPSTNSAWAGLKTTLFAPGFSTANGLVSGTFYHPRIKKLIAFRGAVLQSQNRAFGFFQGYNTNGIGTNQTGAFTLQSVP